jgi:HSP20 family protein
MNTELEKRDKTGVRSATVEQLQNSGPAYSPDVDIYVSDDAALFAVEIPGVKKGDVTIQVDETNSLIIQGKNSFQEPKNPIMRQYNVGDYYRAFQLSDQYDKEKISAKFENGLLEITIPRKEESKPRKIEITA